MNIRSAVSFDHYMVATILAAIRYEYDTVHRVATMINESLLINLHHHRVLC